MGLYEVPLSVSLFWDRDYVRQLPCVMYNVFVKECEYKRDYVF